MINGMWHNNIQWNVSGHFHTNMTNFITCRTLFNQIFLCIRGCRLLSAAKAHDIRLVGLLVSSFITILCLQIEAIEIRADSKWNYNPSLQERGRLTINFGQFSPFLTTWNENIQKLKGGRISSWTVRKTLKNFSLELK